MLVAKQAVKTSKKSLATIMLLLTLGLGIAFVVYQFIGFDQIIANGYFFTGSESTVTTSFIDAFVISHIVHVAAGLIVLLVVIVQQLRRKYTKDQMLGLSLGATFWHFVDILWVYLFLFFIFADDLIH